MTAPARVSATLSRRFGEPLAAVSLPRGDGSRRAARRGRWKVPRTINLIANLVAGSTAVQPRSGDRSTAGLRLARFTSTRRIFFVSGGASSVAVAASKCAPAPTSTPTPACSSSSLRTAPPNDQAPSASSDHRSVHPHAARAAFPHRPALDRTRARDPQHRSLCAPTEDAASSSLGSHLLVETKGSTPRAALIGCFAERTAGDAGQQSTGVRGRPALPGDDPRPLRR